MFWIIYISFKFQVSFYTTGLQTFYVHFLNLGLYFSWSSADAAVRVFSPTFCLRHQSLHHVWVALFSSHPLPLAKEGSRALEHNYQYVLFWSLWPRSLSVEFVRYIDWCCNLNIDKFHHRITAYAKTGGDCRHKTIC